MNYYEAGEKPAGVNAAGVALRWAHLMVMVAVYLLTIGAMYASLRSQSTDNARRIGDLENKSISQPEWREFADDVKNRLTRIENRFDQQRAMGELQSAQAAKR